MTDTNGHRMGSMVSEVDLAHAAFLVALGAQGVGRSELTEDRVYVAEMNRVLNLSEAIQWLASLPKPVGCSVVASGHAVSLTCERLSPSILEVRNAAATEYIQERLQMLVPAALPHSLLELRTSAGSLHLTQGQLFDLLNRYDFSPLTFAVVRAGPAELAEGIIAILRISPTSTIEIRLP